MDLPLTGAPVTAHINGLTDHRPKDADIVDHLVELVEKKAAEIETEKRREAEFAAAQ
jgi:(E)-4-hydroxy-3-methylbut-2-enyl-diphosphate synthase